MKTMKTRGLSIVLVISLLLSMWSPATFSHVSATEAVNGNANSVTTQENGTVSGDITETTEESTEQEESYTIVFVEESGSDTVISNSITKTPNSTLQLFPRLKDKIGIYINSAEFTYTSSNEELASVSDSGLVTIKNATEESKVDIVVTWKSEEESVGNVQAIYTIYIKTAEVESVALEKDKKTLIVNETYTLSPTVTPSEASQEVVYTVDKEEIVTVSGDGTVKAVAEGTAVVTVASKEDANKKDTIEITVIDVPVAVEFEQEVYSVRETESITVAAQLVYSSGKKIPVANSELTLLSQNETLVTVDSSGVVTAKDIDSFPQTAVVTATYHVEYMIDGEKVTKNISAVCEVTVVSVQVEGIRLDNKETEITMKIGDEYRLLPVVIPDNASIKDLKFKSSDSDIAKVGSKGKITAKSIGDVVITVSSVENPEIKVEFKVKVYQTEFNIVELGANGTDTKSDRSTINKILKYADLIEEPIDVIVPAGTYIIDGMLTIYSDTNLLLDKDAIIQRKQSAGDTHMLRSAVNEKIGGYGQCSNITITGGVWDGNADGSSATNGNIMYFGHSKDITIKDTIIKNGSGVHLIEFAGVQNALIENVELYGYKMCPVSDVYEADKEAIQLDYCSSVSAPAMKPHDGTACDNITIRNCNIHDYMAGIGTHTEGSKASTNIRIENNKFENITNACVNLRKFKDVTIANNTANNCTTFVYASNATGTITGNMITNGTSYRPKTNSGLRAKNGITVSNGSSFTIEKNTITKAKSNGICVWNGSTAIIKNNKIKSNKLYGIRSQGSTITLKKNTFSKNKKGLYDTYADAKIKSSDDIRAYYIDIEKSYTYTGTAVKPQITIKNLKKKYYKVTYKNNKKPGTATVIIKGKGKVKKSLKIKFKIK